MKRTIKNSRCLSTPRAFASRARASSGISVNEFRDCQLIERGVLVFTGFVSSMDKQNNQGEAFMENKGEQPISERLLNR